jgi:hypothetical protein
VRKPLFWFYLEWAGGRRRRGNIYFGFIHNPSCLTKIQVLPYTQQHPAKFGEIVLKKKKIREIFRNSDCSLRQRYYDESIGFESYRRYPMDAVLPFPGEAECM